jgi:hypothetical protein
MNKLLFQNILIKPLDKQHRFDFFTISYFDAHYQTEDKPFNEGLIQSYVAWNFVKGVGIGLGGTYNYAQKRPKTAILPTRSGKYFFLLKNRGSKYRLVP